MKIAKKLNLVLCLLIICSILFTACGEKEPSSTNYEAVPDETTVVLETTSDGGTIEQDSEGNKIIKGENGKVISVEDKEGNPIDVNEYLTTHTWVESTGDSSGDSDSSSDFDSSSGSGSSSVSGESESSGSPGGSSSGTNDNEVEESIPVVIVTIPDEEDLIELPDL